MTGILSKAAKYLLALLGLGLIVSITVFPAGAALWIAFAAAIGTATVGAADTALSVLERRLVASLLAVGVTLSAGFLILATLVFEAASLNWLVAIAGGAIELAALTALTVPRIRPGVRVEAQPAGETQREEPRLAA